MISQEGRLLKLAGSPTDAAMIARAAELIRAGRLVAFPTETVYGLGAAALDPAAVQRIYEAKGRPATNPVIVHVADVADARALVEDWPDAAQLLAQALWPGPLTLVCRRAAVVPDIVTAGGPTVAIRVPAHPVAMALLRAAGMPIAAPSANRSTHISPTIAEHVARSLGDRVDLILDGGPTSGGIESTVVDVTVDPPRVLRLGPISPSAVAATRGGAFGAVIDRAPLHAALARHVSEAGGVSRSPGLQERHYAPSAPVVLFDDRASLNLATEARRAAGERVGVLDWAGCDDVRGGSRLDSPHGLIQIEMPLDSQAYAARLYAALHVLESEGVDVILAMQPPASEEWLAIRDRLRRAATR